MTAPLQAGIWWSDPEVALKGETVVVRLGPQGGDVQGVVEIAGVAENGALALLPVIIPLSLSAEKAKEAIGLQVIGRRADPLPLWPVAAPAAWKGAAQGATWKVQWYQLDLKDWARDGSDRTLKVTYTYRQPRYDGLFFLISGREVNAETGTSRPWNRPHLIYSPTQLLRIAQAQGETENFGNALVLYPEPGEWLEVR